LKDSEKPITKLLITVNLKEIEKSLLHYFLEMIY